MVMTQARNRTYSTHNTIPADQRLAIIEILNQALAETLDLKTQVKQAHWNVKGLNFIALHEMFDTFATTLEGYVDMLAERVTALGGTAMGTARIAASASTLPEYDLTAVNGQQHLEALLARYGQYASSVRANIDKTAELGDADTADLFTEISRQIDSDMWFIEAHLQG
ncbi:MAG: DNA starvation/stationary phase protection protein Dps [Synechococcaceae cyanobacterium SM2_3_2]|nr:DNA starvation/stationary phase protection protein Dps [Synechococcaceae cyanobacterium SM2_3_2]